MLTKGDVFPDFSLPNQDGAVVNRTDLIGKWVILYVYPKDDTPGCTIEGKEFSAGKENFDKLNAVILGLSEDGVASHKDFCNKYNFTIDLLADEGGKLLKEAGVEQTDYKGTMYWSRTTFIIDPKGHVAKVYDKVKAEGHEKQVLEDLKELQKQPVA